MTFDILHSLKGVSLFRLCIRNSSLKCATTCTENVCLLLLFVLFFFFIINDKKIFYSVPYVDTVCCVASTSITSKQLIIIMETY